MATRQFKSGFSPEDWDDLYVEDAGLAEVRRHRQKVAKATKASDKWCNQQWLQNMLERNDVVGGGYAPYIPELRKALDFLMSTRMPAKAPEDTPEAKRLWKAMRAIVANGRAVQRYMDEWGDLLDYEVVKALAPASQKGFWGAQGYNAGAAVLGPKLDQYYDHVNREELPISEEYEHAHPATLELVHDYLAARGFQASCMPGRDLLLTYRGAYKSNGGLTYFGDRRTPGLAKFAIRDSFVSRKLDPVVLGSKNERNKVRCVFMSSFADLFRYNRVIRPVHNALAGAPFIAWRGYKAVEADVFDFCKRRRGHLKAVMMDAEAMDTWVRKAHTTTIKEVMSANGCTDEWSDEFDNIASQMFEIPILTHSGWRTGEHALFSGLPPTNDFECYLTIDVSVRFVHALRWKSLNPVFGREYFFVVLGDDIMIWLDTDMLEVVPSDEELRQLSTLILNAKGLAANAEKQDVSDIGCFCKRYYNPKWKESAYPIGMAANSFVHPRDGRPLAEDEEGAVRFCHMFSNIGRSHPLRKQALSAFLQRYPFLREYIPKLTTADFTDYYRREGSTSWEFLLTGERLSPTDEVVLEVKEFIAKACPAEATVKEDETV